MIEILNRCAQGFQGPFRDHMMMNHSGVNFRFFFLFIVGALALVLLVKFLVAWLVYKDALSKNIENKKVWFFLVFITDVLGVIFYFIMVIYQHKNNITTNNSPHITEKQPTVENQIPTPVQSLQTLKRCLVCGIDGDGKFCPKCGTKYN